MNRWYGSLSAPEITSGLTRDSVLCLPIGSYEQHGPHLPLHTDTVIAEKFTTRLVDRYGDQYDLWAVPAVPYGLSLEHVWSPGTISLRAGLLSALLDKIVGEYVRATPARRLLIVNGHAGNRGILEAAIYELRAAHQVRACVVHPSPLAAVRADTALPEVHAGISETSVMLTLAPGDVRLDPYPAASPPAKPSGMRSSAWSSTAARPGRGPRTTPHRRRRHRRWRATACVHRTRRVHHH